MLRRCPTREKHVGLLLFICPTQLLYACHHDIPQVLQVENGVHFRVGNNEYIEQKRIVVQFCMI